MFTEEADESHWLPAHAVEVLAHLGTRMGHDVDLVATDDGDVYQAVRYCDDMSCDSVVYIPLFHGPLPAGGDRPPCAWAADAEDLALAAADAFDMDGTRLHLEPRGTPCHLCDFCIEVDTYLAEPG